jgi:hypothetical protein
VELWACFHVANRPIKAFTLTFEDAAYDEGPIAFLLLKLFVVLLARILEGDLSGR